MCFLLRRPLDEIEPSQVNARKRLVLDVPFFELPLRKPQMENLQPVLHLRHKKLQPSTRAKKGRNN